MAAHKSFAILVLLWFLSNCTLYSNVLAETNPDRRDIEAAIDDGMASNAIDEMKTKLDIVLNQQHSCLKDEVLPRPCFDLTSGQSVLTQLCDRITSIESKVNKITTQVSTAQRPTEPMHNSENPSPQIEQLKTAIDDLRRSSVFYASRKDKIGNFTHDKIRNYRATVNSGVNFDPSNGIFKAPYEGIYHFALSYQKTPEVDLEAHLVVDNEIIAAAHDEYQAHIDLLTSLRSGQEVWTDLTTNSIPVDSEVTFTFSGFLVD